MKLESAGDSDDNSLATDRKIVDMGSDFNLSVAWRSPDPSNRGPYVLLTGKEGTDLRQVQRERIFHQDKIDLRYGGDAISSRGSPFNGEALFNGDTFKQKSLEAGKPHLTEIVKRGDRIRVYTDGRKNIEKRVNTTGRYRLVIAGSATWGSRSSIVYDGINYTESETRIHQKLNETVFVGSGKEALKAIALNQTVFPAEEYSEVKEKADRHGKPLKTREIGNINSAFDISGEKYYPGGEKKAVYVAALAARRNASLTFDKEKADRDFSNYTLKEIQSLFIQKFSPHHVVVADLDSGKGKLAALMAVRQGIIPINSEYSGEKLPESESDFETRPWNRINGVNTVETKIEQAFERIGVNRETLTNGRYVSLLSAPRRIYPDPVEKSLIKDPEDGEYFFSDLSYGNLDSDRRLEAGVGRYPERLSSATVLYHRSLNREKGKEAVVAAEYLHSNWPEVLATFGGGLWNGKSASHYMERQGYNVTFLVEKRARPVALIFDLVGTPTQLDVFVGLLDSGQKILAQKLGKAAGVMVKDSAYMFRGAKYGEEVLEIYLEYSWKDWSPLKQKIDLPTESSFEEVNGLVRSFLPERHRELNRTTLIHSIGSADILYYQGIGDSGSWIMPNKDSGLLKNRYTGENSLKPEDLPKVERTVVWDNSDLAATKDAKMKEGFIDKGAVAFLGYSSVNYGPYSSRSALNFFRYGDYIGDAAKKAVNRLRSASNLLEAPSIRKGTRKKMEESLNLYGNPESIKDPVQDKQLDKKQECRAKTCRVTVTVDPDYTVKNIEDGKTVEFSSNDYLLKEGAPITPLYRSVTGFEGEVISIKVRENFSRISNVSFQESKAYTHGDDLINLSQEFRKFPEKTHDVTVSDELVYIQSGMQKINSTARILEQSELTIKFRSNTTIDLETSGRDLYSEIYTRNHGNASLLVQLDNRTIARNVSLQKGLNKVDLGRIPYGVQQVKADLYRKEILATNSEVLKVERPLRVEISGKLVRGTETGIKATLRNPNSFRIEETVNLSLGKMAAPSLLENRIRTVVIGPQESEKVSWRVIGIGKSTNVTVENNTEKMMIQPAKNSFSSQSTINAIKFKSEASGLKIGFKSDKTDLEFSSDRASLEIRESVDNTSQVLRAPEFEVRKKRGGGLTEFKVRTPEGSYTEIHGENSMYVERGLKKVKAGKYIDKLEAEVSKFRNLIYESSK